MSQFVFPIMSFHFFYFPFISFFFLCSISPMRSPMLHESLSDFYLFYFTLLIFLFRFYFCVFRLGLCSRAFLIVAISFLARRIADHGPILPFPYDASSITCLFGMTRHRSLSFEWPIGRACYMFFIMLFYLIICSSPSFPYLLCAVVRGCCWSSPSDVSQFSLRFSILCGYDVSLCIDIFKSPRFLYCWLCSFFFTPFSLIYFRSFLSASTLTVCIAFMCS
jgi:hypothetical protein